MLLRAPYIAYRLLNEALHRITGIDREASVATTVFTAGVLGGALLPLAAPIFRVFRVKPRVSNGCPDPSMGLDCPGRPKPHRHRVAPGQWHAPALDLGANMRSYGAPAVEPQSRARRGARAGRPTVRDHAR